MQRFCISIWYFCIWTSKFTILWQRKKNQNRKQQIANKNAVESLRFQTHYGLKVKGYEEGDLFQQLADIEVDFISELGLTQDILDIKKMIDGVRANLHEEPTPMIGDFCTSICAIALKIASIPELDKMQLPVSWQEQVDKKILTIFYPDEKRNAVVEWAKMNGYNTSTYLGKPIVKFTKLYIRIERRDGSLQSSGLSNVRKSWRWQMDQERLDWAIKNISRQNTLKLFELQKLASVKQNFLLEVEWFTKQ